MKYAIITGGNSGIGYATARLLKTQGYQVLITGRDEGRLAIAAKELNVDYVVADMADITKLEALAKDYEKVGLDVLVLNAAAATFKPIEKTQMNEFNDYLDTNIKGPYFLIKALVGPLIQNKGAITVVTSAIVNNGAANASLYSLTKGAMDAMVRSLSCEFAPHNVRINSVAPGAINTAIFSKFGVPEAQLKQRRDMLEKTIPLGRYGEPDEVAHAIVAQLQSTYVTGATWCVDGGVNA